MPRVLVKCRVGGYRAGVGVKPQPPEKVFINDRVGRSGIVPVICDVLTAVIKKPRSGFSGGQNAPEKNRTKAVGRLRFFVGQAAAGGAARTGLLCAVPSYTIFYNYLLDKR
jgi:hypothetical protein